MEGIIEFFSVIAGAILLIAIIKKADSDGDNWDPKPPCDCVGSGGCF